MGSDDGAGEHKPINDRGTEPEPEEGIDDALEGERILESCVEQVRVRNPRAHRYGI